MQLSLGFSPCPNDTFIFDALLHGKVDTEGLTFAPYIADVEDLNQRAFRNELSITKLSYHAFAFLLDQYALMEAGSALGNKVGPLLIAKQPMDKAAIPNAHIAIPGKYTTANFLLSLAYPEAQQREEMLFSDIEDAVLDGRVDAGLIIHENRFTYQDKGLVKLIDLGEYWEATTAMPIPLGGIVVQRSLPREVQQAVNRVMQRSVAFAFEHPQASKDFIKQHAQEMEEAVMYKHIKLYVNDFTKQLGLEGRAAVQRLFDIAMAKGVIPNSELPIFV
ncbi:MAG: 1,4-dihydroxy-6-naphthoate synthase [Bacteroidetes bacterium]|jgi:1,4-dihydroxy-6-naphthoate synthase|nr:1,4-dihydroxy-6-naphthoate synthase [Bacteroidota bacterium]